MGHRRPARGDGVHGGVPEGHLLGDDGDGMGVFFEHFLYWRLMQAAAAIGTSKGALDQMADA